MSERGPGRSHASRLVLKRLNGDGSDAPNPPRLHPTQAMSPLATSLLAIFLLGTTAGQLLFKAASLRAARQGRSALWPQLALEPLLWIGIAIYAFALLLWLALVSLLPLWQAVMVANLDILLVMVCGRIVFGERITLPRAAAVSLITLGVALVGWS
jgi:drug/metabolite transporter (DMT)-like permease